MQEEKRQKELMKQKMNEEMECNREMGVKMD